MHDGRDRALLRGSIASRWPIDETKLKNWLDELENALAAADTVRQKNSILRTIIAVVGQMQSALEWEAQQQRLDEGKPTENVAVQEYRFAFDRRG